MATQTTNFNLVKPETTDPIDISQLNGNMDIIDGAMNGTVKYTSQTLTDQQKTQARTNIGAADSSEVSNITSILNDAIIIEMYEASLASLGASASHTFTASDFNFTAKPGYTVLGLMRWTINSNMFIYFAGLNLNGNVLGFRNTSSSEVTNITATIRVAWIRNSLL